MADNSGSGNQGFASMSPEDREAIARKGGESQGKHNNPGNFANDKEKARRAGKEGGSKTGNNRNSR